MATRTVWKYEAFQGRQRMELVTTNLSEEQEPKLREAFTG